MLTAMLMVDHWFVEPNINMFIAMLIVDVGSLGQPTNNVSLTGMLMKAVRIGADVFFFSTNTCKQTQIN